MLGTFGEFHPDTLEALDVSGALCGFEVYLDAIPEPKAKSARTKPALSLSLFQSLKRDYAFVVDAAVEAGNVVKAVSSADKKLIVAFRSSISSPALRLVKARSRSRLRCCSSHRIAR